MYVLLGVAALNQYIYVVGGYDGYRQLSSVERYLLGTLYYNILFILHSKIFRYDTEHKIWQFVSSIKIARSALSLTVLDGKLYAMGKLVYFISHNGSYFVVT